MRQLPLRMPLRDASRLASFVPSGNEEIFARLSGGWSQLPRVTWVWGRAGVGKSHLLQAACADTAERDDTTTYLDLGAAAAPAMLDGGEAFDLVCLDNLDAVAADAGWNAALFRLYTLLQDGRGRLLVATTTPPAALTFVLADLGSRLRAGAVHQLHELDEPGLVDALQRRAARRGLELTQDAALYLVHRLPREPQVLFGVLEQLDEASLAAQRRLTIPFLREALEARPTQA